MAKRRKARPQHGRTAERAARARQRWVVVFGAAAAVALVLLVLLQTWPFGDHDHVAGPHGGTLHTLDGGSRHFHAEVVVGHTGAVQVYALGETPEDAMTFEGGSVLAEFRADGDPTPYAVVLHPDPAAGGGPVPRLVGRLPGDRLGQRMQLDVPGLVIQGEAYRLHLDWRSQVPPSEAARLVAEEQRGLYLRPGGQYTEDDIEANGRTTAAEKFRGQRSNHAHAKPGESLCPTARRPADPRFEWVVGGRRLRFCCPQCIDEFVASAKADTRHRDAGGPPP